MLAPICQNLTFSTTWLWMQILANKTSYGLCNWLLQFWLYWFFVLLCFSVRDGCLVRRNEQVFCLFLWLWLLMFTVFPQYQFAAWHNQQTVRFFLTQVVKGKNSLKFQRSWSNVFLSHLNGVFLPEKVWCNAAPQSQKIFLSFIVNRFLIGNVIPVWQLYYRPVWSRCPVRSLQCGRKPLRSSAAWRYTFRSLSCPSRRSPWRRRLCGCKAQIHHMAAGWLERFFAPNQEQ